MRQLAQALSVVALSSVASVAVAAEVSMVSGLYRTEESETTAGGTSVDNGKKTTIDVGGRFADQLDTHMFWFGQAMLTLRSYDKGDAADAPSDTTSLSLGGGVRYYFAKLSENVSPFAYGIGSYKNEQDGAIEGGNTVESEENGLFYGASFGIRLGLGPDFFVDFETPLFESALFASEEAETTDDTGAKTSTETKKTELYVNTSGAFQSMLVALGMRL